MHTDFNIFLDNGQVVATGKHSDLLRTCAPYQARYGATTQSEG
jgi:ABC-type multidrug transport system fused ATPase/permease subunit